MGRNGPSAIMCTVLSLQTVTLYNISCMPCSTNACNDFLISHDVNANFDMRERFTTADAPSQALASAGT